MVSLITKYLCSFDDFPQKTVDSSSIIRTIIQNTWVYRLCTRDEGFKSEQRTSTPPRSIKTFLQNVKSYMKVKGMTCRMKWVTCYKLPCTRCPCRSPWHFPIRKKHQLAHHVLCAIFVKTFLLLWNTSPLISATTRVENGFHSSFREILRRNCSHPFQLLYTDTWSWLINSYHSTS